MKKCNKKRKQPGQRNINKKKEFKKLVEKTMSRRIENGFIKVAPDTLKLYLQWTSADQLIEQDNGKGKDIINVDGVVVARIRVTKIAIFEIQLQEYERFVNSISVEGQPVAEESAEEIEG